MASFGNRLLQCDSVNSHLREMKENVTKPPFNLDVPPELDEVVERRAEAMNTVKKELDGNETRNYQRDR